MTPDRYLVFGFQSSGKTTFAAALWHLLDSRETETALSKGKHVGDYRYLEEIAQAWCEGWQVERTKAEQVESIRINLLHPGTGSELVLEFTDLSGEKFEKAFATRLCVPTLVNLVKEASGILLFVTADRLIDDVTILEAFPEEEEEAVPEDAPGEEIPLQVQIVDLLQALRLPPFAKRPVRIAVIVSAWDLTTESSAQNWLAQKMPLLDQYLKHGIGPAEARVYGVSAQGGQISKKGQAPGPDRDRLLALDRPSERIKIVGPDVRDHDLTGPLLWLSGAPKKT